MKPKNSPVPFVIALVIIAAGMYWYFSTGEGNQPPVSTSETSNQTQEKFQTLVGELTPITFDTAIFSDARFNSLVNISTPIAPEPAGRLDPFAAVIGISRNE